MNMTKTLLSLATVALLAGTASAQPKIGLIDLRKVFDDYYKTKAADTLLKDQAADLEKQKKSLLDQYTKATEDYKKALDDSNNQAVSADEREKRKKNAETSLLEIKRMEDQITQFDRTARTTLDEHEDKTQAKTSCAPPDGPGTEVVFFLCFFLAHGIREL